ncbi:MAG: DNA polymerase I [Candidatus Brocadiia bacterium]
MPDRLFLIDAHSHIYQAFYAIKGLTGPDGAPVNAVYGFARLIRKIEQDYEGRYLAVVFDPKGEVFRHEIYDQYKATRKPMPDALQQQIPVIKEMLEAWNIPVLVKDNYEADDVMCAAARRAVQAGMDAVMVTTDKDVEQCIGDHINVLHLHKNKEEWLDPEELKKKKELRPEQIIEVMSLAGDNSDNIPGIYGVGPKTAGKLIREFGTVENLYANLEEVSGDALRKKLSENRDEVELSRRLVTIHDDIPVELTPEDCRVTDGPNPDLVAFFRALGFESLVETDEPIPPDSSTTSETQGNLFDTGSEGRRKSYDRSQTDYSTLTDVGEVKQLGRTLKDKAPFAIDLETTSLNPREARIVGIALSWEAGQGVYVATRGPEGADTCPPERALRILKPIIENAEIGKIGQNLKYDMQVLRAHDVTLRGITCDTLIASYLLHPGHRNHGLDSLAKRHLNYENISIKELIGSGKDQKNMADVPVEKVGPYACEDADIALRLSELLMDQLDECNLMSIFRDMELPLVHVLADMEWRGIRVDQEQLRTISREFETELKELEKKIFKEAGTEFNVNSPQQLSEVLFEKMELPPPRGKTTSTGYSTARDVLEDLADDHPIARYMLRWRKLSKLKSTYADALVEIVDEKSGRLYTSFNQTGTATGRLSSSDPNLQNIPIRTETGRRIRKAFIPGEKDMLLLGADYSQVELRILAHCSEDETLRGAFENGRDIHRFVAAQIHDVTEEEVTESMRSRAKAVNFGIVYGQTPYGLSGQLGISVEKAREFIDQYFDRYPGVKRFIGKTIQTARENGYVRTLSGRRRHIKGIRDSGTVRSAAERIAVNSVIQGTAADMIKLAMITIHDELEQISDRSAMLLQIHDELVLEVPEVDIDPVRQFVVDRMSGAMDLSVPIEVDVATGRNWDEAK